MKTEPNVTSDNLVVLCPKHKTHLLIDNTLEEIHILLIFRRKLKVKRVIHCITTLETPEIATTTPQPTTVLVLTLISSCIVNVAHACALYM